jgi:hypothetical protein
MSQSLISATNIAASICDSEARNNARFDAGNALFAF